MVSSKNWRINYNRSGKLKMKRFSFLVAGVAGLLTAISANAGTLEDVRAKGFIQCGVSQGLPGFSNADDSGKWTGLDVEMCRAVAAAVFGDAQAVKFSPYRQSNVSQLCPQVRLTSCHVIPLGP